MSEFVRVATLAEFDDRDKLLVEVEDRLVVLFRVEGEIFALDDVCTHDDGPLGEGQLTGHEIACPRHGAKFDVRTGQALTMPATRPTAAHEVKLEGSAIYVRLGSPPVVGAARIASAPSSAAPSAALAAAAPSPAVDSPASPSPAAPVGNLGEEVVREALKQVIDPELFVNIVDLGLIYLVELKEKAEGRADVLVEMTMTSPACPAGPQLLHNSKEVLKRLEGVDDVEVKLVMTPPWTPDRMTDDARDKLGIF